MPRREAVLTGLAAMAYPLVPWMVPPPDRGVRSFRLGEPAGLRRFGYPVHDLIPGVGDVRHFRLLRDGRAIPAQFRAVDGEGSKKAVALDFIASLGPLEIARYEVHYGRDVVPGPEPREGLAIEKRDGKYRISQGNVPKFEIPEDLSGFIGGAGSPRLAYLRDGSAGLSIRERGRPENSGEKWLPARSKVTREGPYAVGLRFEGPGPSGSMSRLDLTIPLSKSWAQAVWSVEDPGNRVAGLGLDLNLMVEGSPTLVDFGAGSTIYGQLRGQQRMEMVAGRAVGESGPVPGPGWLIRQGEGGQMPIFAASTADAPRPAEGWAHIMDARRCTALALAEFGRAGGRDRISARADGNLALVRDFSIGDAEPARGPKSLAFWLHFVPMPVQVGAATSPQSMLAPLRIEWDRPPD
jgi:hypothetical protein